MSVAIATTDSILTAEEVLGYLNPDLVARLRVRLGLDESAAVLLFDDTKMFLYLCGRKRKGDPALAPTKAIDKGWHEFILFTEDYAAFCQGFFGRFIHHRPHRKNDPKDGGRSLRLTRELALATFGELSDNWTLPSKDRTTCVECDGGGCNEPECHGDDPAI